ncbi:hypothetical protein GIB67_003535 [Kingdonia uniflora]|uniref:Pectinesterase inhibitor domain-containing protein n=1 Tax=Kingdonia uniflora TaxID=39325 RepID=A0A7J7MEM7_9MAGN|nr:hypothetical protein GIB67_003535 [Kingdonia uniflora]
MAYLLLRLPRTLLLISTIFLSTTWALNTTTTLDTHLSKIQSICKATPYPDVCFDSLKLSISINISPTILTYVLQTVQLAITEAEKLTEMLFNSRNKVIVEKQRGTIQDCRELHQITLSSLQRSVSRISSSSDTRKLSDAKAFLSAALTNKNTCLEGLETATGLFKPVQMSYMVNAYKYISNSLSILATPTFKPLQGRKNRRLLGYPRWVSRKSRRILESNLDDEYDPSETLTVAADGTGNFTTVMDAIHYAPNNSYDQKHQAVALRVNAGLAAVYRCVINGYQDTLYSHSFRQFYRECDIFGTVDYTFGNAAVVLQGCNIVSKLPMPGQYIAITAQSRDTPDMNTGISIQNCSILASDELYESNLMVESYLGRPWREYARTVYLESYIDDFITPAGWKEWPGDVGLGTLYYGEYSNSGPGSRTDNRVTWPGYHVMEYYDASNFSVSEFITGKEWLDSTSFPYDNGV